MIWLLQTVMALTKRKVLLSILFLFLLFIVLRVLLRISPIVPSSYVSCNLLKGDIFQLLRGSDGLKCSVVEAPSITWRFNKCIEKGGTIRRDKFSELCTMTFFNPDYTFPTNYQECVKKEGYGVALGVKWCRLSVGPALVHNDREELDVSKALKDQCVVLRLTEDRYHHTVTEEYCAIGFDEPTPVDWQKVQVGNYCLALPESLHKTDEMENRIVYQNDKSIVWFEWLDDVNLSRDYLKKKYPSEQFESYYDYWEDVIDQQVLMIVLSNSTSPDRFEGWRYISEIVLGLESRYDMLEKPLAVRVGVNEYNNAVNYETEETLARKIFYSIRRCE